MTSWSCFRCPSPLGATCGVCPSGVDNVVHYIDSIVRHIGRVGLGLVVPAGGRRDPREGFGDAVVGRRNVHPRLGDARAEHPERDAIILVRLLVVVGTVDPQNEVLGGVAVLERYRSTRPSASNAPRGRPPAPCQSCPSRIGRRTAGRFASTGIIFVGGSDTAARIRPCHSPWVVRNDRQ